jgi:hypothetical protein
MIAGEDLSTRHQAPILVIEDATSAAFLAPLTVGRENVDRGRRVFESRRMFIAWLLALAVRAEGELEVKARGCRLCATVSVLYSS